MTSAIFQLKRQRCEVDGEVVLVSAAPEIAGTTTCVEDLAASQHHVHVSCRSLYEYALGTHIRCPPAGRYELKEVPSCSGFTCLSKKSFTDGIFGNSAVHAADEVGETTSPCGFLGGELCLLLQPPEITSAQKAHNITPRTHPATMPITRRKSTVFLPCGTMSGTDLSACSNDSSCCSRSRIRLLLLSQSRCE